MVVPTLSDRLRQVLAPRAVGAPAPVSLPVADPPSSLDDTRAVPGTPCAVPARGIDRQRIADVLAGQWIDHADGGVVVIDRHYTPDRLHGRERIGRVVDTLQSARESLATLWRAWPARGADGEPQGAPCERLCFLDLETTGLAGGAGTQAFLVGCAVIEDDGLHVRQFLLPGFEHERALLATVAEWTAAQGALVTFNGRSFDVPLIETRFVFHRLASPLANLPNVDMLHPARRLWKERPTIAGPALDDESCKLSVLERHLAGVHRVGDVPGFEMPSRFFRFIRSGDARPLEAVLEHNRIDLISLAVVMARALRLIAEGPAATMHPRECLGLGHLYERAGVSDNAEACYAHAAAMAARVGREPDVRGEALRRLAVCRRRAGRMADAAAAWQEIVGLPGCPAVLRREAREALAIHHEHRSRDLESARTLVLDVLAETPAARWREQAEYRLKRIERKLATKACASSLPWP